MTIKDNHFLTVGTRGKVSEFKKAYQKDFLKSYGLNLDEHYLSLPKNQIHIEDDDIVTYIGKRHWGILK